MIVLSKADMADNLSLIKEELHRINPTALVLESRHQHQGLYVIDGFGYGKPNHGLVAYGKKLELSALGAKESIERTENRQEVIAEGDFLAGKKVCLLSGIADPDSFSRTIINLGASIALDLRYPDHYSYKDRDIPDMVNKCRDRKLDTIVTTEKDLMRLPPAIREAGLTVLALKIELKITENEKVFLSEYIGYWLARGLGFLIVVLPLKTNYIIGQSMGVLGYYLLKKKGGWPLKI